MGNLTLTFSVEKVESAVDWFRNQGYEDVYANELYRRCHGSYMPNKGRPGFGSPNSQWGMEISKHANELGLEFIEMDVFSRLKSDTGEFVKSSRWRIL